VAKISGISYLLLGLGLTGVIFVASFIIESWVGLMGHMLCVVFMRVLAILGIDKFFLLALPMGSCSS
jgi:hypothetical protein